MTEQLTHTGPLWRWTSSTGTGTWHFLTIDGEAGEALSATALMRRLEGAAKGFGSIKVSARIGDTVFKTSLFPSKELLAGATMVVSAVLRARLELGPIDELCSRFASSRSPADRHCFLDAGFSNRRAEEKKGEAHQNGET